jgi:hypothetical protein
MPLKGGIMTVRQREVPTRGAGAKSNPCAVETESRTRNSFEPVIGRPWPELKNEDISWPDGENSVGIHYESSVGHDRLMQSFTIGLKLKTRVLLICLLMIVAAYAAFRGDGTLMREVVRAIAPQHTFESPP